MPVHWKELTAYLLAPGRIEIWRSGRGRPRVIQIKVAGEPSLANYQRPTPGLTQFGRPPSIDYTILWDNQGSFLDPAGNNEQKAAIKGQIAVICRHLLSTNCKYLVIIECDTKQFTNIWAYLRWFMRELSRRKVLHHAGNATINIP